MNRKLNVAIYGYGNIGRGAFSLVNAYSSDEVKVVKVLDRPGKKEELKELYAETYEEIVNDKNIDLVIECLGGDLFAYPAIKAALNKGKSVVTSNKETVSLHLDEYLDLAKKNNCHFRFEASVGGGIPLINTMCHILAYDEISSFKGILNGTTNFIITKMMDENMSFDDALKLAKELGFAEPDPSADLLGLDMVRKGVILSSLAYGIKIDVNDVPHFGIQNLNSDIIYDIKKMNKSLKLCVQSVFDNGKLSLCVMPLLIENTNSLNGIKYEFNGASFECKYNSLVTLMGKGAGRYPTAAAIMQDVVDIMEGKEDPIYNNPIPTKNSIEYSGDYYIVEDGFKGIVSSPCVERLNKALFVAKID